MFLCERAIGSAHYTPVAEGKELFPQPRNNFWLFSGTCVCMNLGSRDNGGISIPLSPPKAVPQVSGSFRAEDEPVVPLRVEEYSMNKNVFPELAQREMSAVRHTHQKKALCFSKG